MKWNYKVLPAAFFEYNDPAKLMSEYTYMENVKSVPENPAVCWTFLCFVPEFLISCYYVLHFRCLSHFSVMELQNSRNRFSPANLKYELL